MADNGTDPRQPYGGASLHDSTEKIERRFDLEAFELHPFVGLCGLNTFLTPPVRHLTG